MIDGVETTGPEVVEFRSIKRFLDDISLELLAFRQLRTLIEEYGSIELSYHELTDEADPYYQCVMVDAKTGKRTLKQRNGLALAILSVKDNEPKMRCLKCGRRKPLSQLYHGRKDCKPGWAWCLLCNRNRGKRPLNERPILASNC